MIVIAMLTAIVTLVGSWLMHDALTDRAKRRARSLSVVERDGILRLMRAGDHSDLQHVLEQLARNPDIETVRILNPTGEVQASSRAHETGRPLPDHLTQTSDRGDVKPHGGATSGRGTVVHVVQPFRNSAECHTCHRDAGPILAWFDMDVEVSAHAVGFTTFTTLSVALGALYLLAAVATVVPTLSSTVVGRMRRLTAAMRLIQRGDDSVSMAATGSGELVRIDQILKDLLQFAKPTPPMPTPFDLNALVRDAVTLTFPSGDTTCTARDV